MRNYPGGLIATILLLLSLSFAGAQYFAHPEDTRWNKPFAVFHAHDLTIGKYARVVTDAAASDGKAVQVTAGSGRDSHMFAGGWAPVKTDAAYAVAFRLRLSMIDINVAKNAQVLYVGTESMANGFHMPAPLRLEVIHRTVKDDPRTESVVQWYFVDAPSLDAVKDYHDYVLKFDHPMPGFIGVRAYWFGRAYATVWMDKATVQETALPSEAEQLKDVTLDGPLTVDHHLPNTLVCTGPYNWTYHIPNVVGGKCSMVSNELIGDGHGAKGHFQALPDTAAALAKYDVILLSEIRLGDLSAKQKVLLSEYVKSGGGLVILGGIGSYGKGRVHTSPLLMDLLPVQTTGVWDLKKAPGDGLAIKADARFDRLNWQADPRVFYYHNAIVKPGAKVWATGTAHEHGIAVDVPLLVSRRYGNGMVYAFLGSELGDPQPTQTAIWAWQDWGRFLTMILNAARGSEDRDGNEPPQWQAPVVETIPPMPAPELRHSAETFKSTTFEIAKVSSQKLVYRPGEWATAYVTLINGTAQPVSGKLTVAILSNFQDKRVLQSTDVTLRAGEISKIPVVWKIENQQTFGHEVQAVLTDAQGALIASRGDYYSVGTNNYRLGQYSTTMGGWSWEYGDTMPNVTPLDCWYFVDSMRSLGVTAEEIFAWAPDDFGNLSPEEDHWFAGQAQSDGLIYRANIHAAIDAAHANGLALITYGKNVMSVAGLHVKRDGVEITRMHPEWAQWMVDGEPKWMFDATRYRMTFDQNARIRATA